MSTDCFLKFLYFTKDKPFTTKTDLLKYRVPVDDIGDPQDTNKMINYLMKLILKLIKKLPIIKDLGLISSFRDYYKM